jgi:hypothetical protein
LKEFSKKCNYDTHCNRKYQCERTKSLEKHLQKAENLSQKNVKNPADFKCVHCNKSYCNKYTLERHIQHSCKESKNKNIQDELKEIKEEFKKEMTEMNKEIRQLRNENHQLIALTNQIQLKNNTEANGNREGGGGSNHNTTTIHGDHNTVTNNNIYITIPFGSENYHRLSESDKIDIMNYGKNCIIKAFNLIHFNKQLPEYQNILGIDVSNNTVQVIGEENQLVTLNIDEVVHTSFDNTWDFVDNLAVRSDRKFLNKCDKEWSQETQQHMKDLRFIPTTRNNEKDKIKESIIVNTK